VAEDDNITVKFDGGSWSFKEMALKLLTRFLVTLSSFKNSYKVTLI